MKTLAAPRKHALRRPPAPVAAPLEGSLAARWWSTTWVPALLGAVLLWASFPPLDLWPLAWLAPIPWLDLIRRPQLHGRRPYLAIFTAGLAFWLAAIYWLCLPHPATCIGWFALSVSLALYAPLFVGVSRGAVHRLGVPLAVVAPVAWVATEFARAHILGFGMVYLSHTQSRWLGLIQISDLAGAYGVSFVIIGVAACLLTALTQRDWKPLASAGALLAAVLGYGAWRTSGEHSLPGPRVGIVQECIKQSYTEGQEPAHEVIDKHIALSVVAAREKPDVILWPESMWRYPLAEIEPDASPPPGETWDMDKLREGRAWYAEEIQNVAKYIRRPLVLGIEFHAFGAGRARRYNSAVLVTPQGEIAGRYDKNHRVMFGEFIPLGNYFPWIYSLSPLASGIECGDPDQPPLELGKYRLSPSICFETTVPQRIRHSVEVNRLAGREPDALVNLTNDAWFWGSAQLEQHLACNVFRAVECRKPLAIAANTGLSAAIDADGRILWVAPKWDAAVHVLDLPLDTRQSVYLRMGDWPAALCVAFALLVGVLAWRRGPAPAA